MLIENKYIEKLKMKSNNTRLMYSTDRLALYTKINEESRDSIDRELCDHIRFVRGILQQIYWKTTNEINA